MKKVMVITILFWLAGMGFANAQTTVFSGKLLNSERTGPFIITSTEERDGTNGSRYFKTKNMTIGGGESHLDITIDNATGSPLSIDIYGYTKIPPETVPSVKHIISCSGRDFVSISDRPPGSTYPMNMNIKGIALCVFNPNSIDGLTDGLAYLVINGTETEIAVNTASKFVFSGTLSGGLNQEGNNFVFKGPFGAVLKPQLN